MRAKTFHRKALTLGGTLLFALGCSLLNREGPDVDCSRAQSEATNACREGIIASCSDTIAVYEACSDSDACEKEWQQSGRFRCNESDPLPDLATTEGDASPSSPSASGSGGNPSGIGGNESDPLPDLSTIGGNNAQNSASDSGANGSSTTGMQPQGMDCGNAPCQIGITDGEYIASYTVFEDFAYFTDCTVMWRVSTNGGLPEVLTDQLGGCTDTTTGAIAATDQGIILFSGPEIVRVPLAGGIPQMLAMIDSAGYRATALATDVDNVYWAAITSIVAQNDPVIFRTPLSGESTEVFVNDTWTTQLRVTEGTLFWLEGDNLFQAPANTGPATPVGISVQAALAGTPRGIQVVDSTAFVHSNRAIGSLDLDLGTSIALISDISVESIAVDDTHIYWASSDNVGRGPRSGGQGVRIAPIQSYQPGQIVIDDTYVYWAEGEALVRAPKE